MRVSCPTVNGYDQPEHKNDKVEQTGMNGNHQQKSEVLPRNIRTMLTYVDLLIKDLNDNSSSCDRVIGDRKDPCVVGLLIQALKDEDKYVAAANLLEI